jgi:RNA polymerase sigma-70 factor (ECF subfamily)
MSDLTPDQRAELLNHASSGDEDAWRMLVEIYLPRVHAVVCSQCHDPELAEEITQSTFATIVTKLADYQEEGRFESWLFRIAMNRLRDEMRRRKRHARPTEEATLVSLAGGASGPDDHDSGDTRARVLQAIEQLSEADREVLILRHVSGLSFKEVSEALETPVGTLLARHHRALKKLKSILEDGPESSNGDGEDGQ